jgi:hypothetical protein
LLAELGRGYGAGVLDAVCWAMLIEQLPVADVKYISH